MQPPFSAYQGNEPYMFVCYSHEDRELVYPEIARLHETGFHVWYDEGIAPGSEWSETLARQIKRCGTFLYFVTPNSVASEHCRREVNFALEQPCGIVAVHLKRTELPDGLNLSLSNRQAILKYEHPQASYESKLHQALTPAGQEKIAASPSTLQLGEWTLDIGTERLIREDEEHPLDPKELSVLLHLIDRAPDVVTTEGLLSRTWPDVVVGDNALQQVIARLRRALGDDARQPRYIETLPKRGYRLCIPVSGSSQSAAAQPLPPDAAPVGKPRTGFRRGPVGLALVGLVLLGVAVAYWLEWAPTPEDAQERQTVAVEPFTYPSDNEGLEGYATLLRNEVAYHLARVAQPRMDLVQRVEDADFLARGSMAEVADGVRLFVQVVDTDSGIVMWSKGLELPSQPTEELIATRPEHLATLIFQVTGYIREASSGTESTEAVREWIAGMVETSEMWQGLGGDWDASLNHLKRANELDPDFVMPPLFLANLYVNRLGGRLRYEDAIGPAYEYTRRVLELNEHFAWLAGWVALQDLDYEAAEANFAYALRVGWSVPGVEFNVGLLLLVQGQLDDAIGRFNTALEMGALENQAAAYTLISYAHLAAGRFAAAAKAAETAVVETSGTGAYAHLSALAIQAFAQCYDGDLGSARETVQLGLAAYGEDYPGAFTGPLALLGDTETAGELLSSGEERWASGEGFRVSNYFWGHFHLGDLDQAFVWLVRAIEDREGTFLAPLRRSPILDPIRDDPRFIAAMDRLAEIEAVGTPIVSVAYP